MLAVISTDDVDRDGEVILPSGLNKRNYAGNPVVLLNHQYQELSIGRCLWIKSDGNRIIAKYRVSDKTQDARDTFALLQDECLQAHSIGFIATSQGPPTPDEIKARPDWAACKNVIRAFDLLEFSVVTVPANQNAIALAVAKGLSPELKTFLGPDWESQECWKWEAEPAPVATAEPQPRWTPEELAAAKAWEPEIAPTVSISWKDVERRLVRLMNALDTPEDILKRLRGQV